MIGGITTFPYMMQWKWPLTLLEDRRRRTASQLENQGIRKVVEDVEDVEIVEVVRVVEIEKIFFESQAKLALTVSREADFACRFFKLAQKSIPVDLI